VGAGCSVRVEVLLLRCSRKNSPTENAMIRRVSTKPVIKTTFLLVDQDNNSVVTFWFDIEAKGIKFRSEHAPAQIQHQGKFLRGVRERPFWSDEILAALSVSTERVNKAN